MSSLQRRLYCFVVLMPILLWSGSVYAVAKEADSLIHVLENVPHGKERLNLLLELCRSLYYSEPDIVLKYSGEAYAQAEEIGDSASKADAAIFLGWGHRVTGDQEKAIDYIYKAMTIGRSLQRPDLEGRALLVQGTIQVDEANYPEAEKLLLEARNLLQKTEPTVELGLAVNALGEVRRYRGQLDEALNAYTEAIDLHRKVGFDRGVLLSQNNIGLIYLARKDYAECRKIMFASRNKAIELNSLVVVVESSDAIAQAYLGEKQLDQAIHYADSAYSVAVKYDMKYYISLTSQTISNIYEEKGDLGMALKFLKIHFDADLVREKEQTQKKIATLNYNLSLKEKQSEIEDLSRDKQVRRLAVFAMGAILGLSIIMMLLQIRGSRQRLMTNRMLSRQNERLEELNREKDSLVGIVAHDLKAPLTKVQSLARMLEMIGGLSTQQQDVVQKIEKVTLDGSRLIQDLLDITQAETEGRTVQNSEFDLNHLIEHQMVGHQGHAERKKINLNFTPAEKPIEMFSEESFISRVFDNILSNALKYSPEGKNVFVNISMVQGYACISVKDEGPGISEEDQAKMFRKFQKLSARPTAGESSTGLGLAIIKMLVEKLGGYIDVDSKLGEGAKFSVYFPIGK